MRKQIEWQWEQLDEVSWRSKVIGGWLLLHMSGTESMVFVSDKDHEWIVLPPPVPVESEKLLNPFA